MLNFLKKVYRGFIAAQEARAAAYLARWKEANPHHKDLFDEQDTLLL